MAVASHGNVGIPSDLFFLLEIIKALHAQSWVSGLQGKGDGQVTSFHGAEILCWDRGGGSKWVRNICLEGSAMKKIKYCFDKEW